ncbi:MAG: serine protease [Solirubrobacterales bacterium]
MKGFLLRRAVRTTASATVVVIALACWAGAPATASDSSKVGVRIVGGDTTTASEWPWTVAIVRHQNQGGTDLSRLRCGGSLLAATVVLTAAHCLDGQTAATLQAVTGRTTLTSSEGQRHDLTQATVDPDYAGSPPVHDVAILDLATPSTQPQIAIVGPGDNALWATDTIAWVLGWGLTSQGGLKSDTLREVDVPIISDATCTSDYGSGFDPFTMVCAGYQDTGGKDSCNGDSGGPLVVSNGGGWLLAGVVSWGFGCAQADFPGVYARVGEYAEGSVGQWIAGQLAARAGSGTAPPPAIPPTSPPAEGTPKTGPRSAACKRAKRRRTKRRRALRSARSALRAAESNRAKTLAAKRLLAAKHGLRSARQQVGSRCAATRS